MWKVYDVDEVIGEHANFSIGRAGVGIGQNAGRINEAFYAPYAWTHARDGKGKVKP